MNFSTKMGWAAFLVALSVLPLTAKGVNAATSTNSTPQPVTSSSLDERLARISATLQEKASQLPNESKTPEDAIAFGWGNGGGGFGNINRPAWRNGGWRDGGSFLNRSWPNGGWGNGGWRNGGFLNRW